MSWVLERYTIAELVRDRWDSLTRCVADYTGGVTDKWFSLPCQLAVKHYVKVRCNSPGRAEEFAPAVTRLCGVPPSHFEECLEVVPCG